MSFTSWLSNGLGLSSRPGSKRLVRTQQREFRHRFECLERCRFLTTLTVLNTLDKGVGSLRADIAAARNGDTINFAPNLAGQTVTLTSDELPINRNVTITGPSDRNLMVSGGAAPANVGGGGILNDGTLTVQLHAVRHRLRRGPRGRHNAAGFGQ